MRTVNPDSKVKAKPKRKERKEQQETVKLAFCPQRIKSVLPILFKLQNIEEMHPDKVFEYLALLSNKDSVDILSSTEKQKLADYLKKWGYDYKWVL